MQLGRTSIKKSLERVLQELSTDQGLLDESEVEEDSDADVGDDAEEEAKEVTYMAARETHSEEEEVQEEEQPKRKKKKTLKFRGS